VKTFKGLRDPLLCFRWLIQISFFKSALLAQASLNFSDNSVMLMGCLSDHSSYVFSTITLA